MKDVFILKDCTYAQAKPHLPHLSFKMGESCTLPDYMINSMLKNGHGMIKPEHTSSVEPEIKETFSVEPEIKEKPHKRGKAKKVSKS